MGGVKNGEPADEYGTCVTFALEKRKISHEREPFPELTCWRPLFVRSFSPSQPATLLRKVINQHGEGKRSQSSDSTSISISLRRRVVRAGVVRA